jgi:hypothetical protein
MSTLVISEVYGGGGNTNAVYNQDFVELHNTGAVAVDLAGYSLQYASAAGSTWLRVDFPPGATIPPGGYFLIGLALGAGAGVPLPTPDLMGSIALSATSGKVALVSNQTPLTGTDPSTAPGVVDFVGYGPSATGSEGGAPTPQLSPTTSAQRLGNGGQDTGNNAADFMVGAPAPQNSASIPSCFCAGALILTDRGKVAVEDLKIGDLVITTEGDARPISWIGRRTVAKRFGDPSRFWPVRIKAGALDENVPDRDLLISPDHAVLVDGVLINAGALVNGTSVLRETDVAETFVYYHVELDDHALLLVENAPAETFLDTVDRMAFDNWAEHEALYPEGKPIRELPFPRAKARRQVAMHIRRALAARAALVCGDAAAVA